MSLSIFTPRGARNLTVVTLVITNVACGNASEAASEDREPQTFPEADAVVEVPRMRQSISGFGASSAWTLPDASDELADQLFSAELGIGLSLLRLRIAPNGRSSEISTAQKAIARGATVWAAPWSPPGEWKDNGSATDGGSLLREHYQDWADRLATFVSDAAQQGVPIAMLSAQNEPNWTATWETCLWSPFDLTRFVGDYLGPAVDALRLGTRVLAPETQDWTTLSRFATPMLADPAAREYIGAVAVHGYGGRTFAYEEPAAAGKELWVTELDDALPGDPEEESYDPGMGSGLKVARKLHTDLTVASVSAWHYWWLAPRGDLPLTSNGALTDGTALTRRAYVMGNFSKFVRPGFVRVEATGAPRLDVLVTAFRDAPGERLVIVASNAAAADLEQRFVVNGAELDGVTPWITSDELALEEQPPVAVVEGAFTAALPARSVTTFVADLTSVEPEPEPEPEPQVPFARPERGTSDESGCSCDLAGRPRDPNAALLLLAGSSLAAVARRRRAALRQPR